MLCRYSHGGVHHFFFGRILVVLLPLQYFCGNVFHDRRKLGVEFVGFFLVRLVVGVEIYIAPGTEYLKYALIYRVHGRGIRAAHTVAHEIRDIRRRKFDRREQRHEQYDDREHYHEHICENVIFLFKSDRFIAHRGYPAARFSPFTDGCAAYSRTAIAAKPVAVLELCAALRTGGRFFFDARAAGGTKPILVFKLRSARRTHLFTVGFIFDFRAAYRAELIFLGYFRAATTAFTHNHLPNRIVTEIAVSIVS